jgi:glycosyltransferase involved in cell wall biosynthesis
MKVTFDCDARAPSGYSKASRAHMKALIQAGVDVLIEDRPHDMVTVPLDPWWEKEYEERSKRKERTPIKIVHHTPDLCTPNPGQLTVAMVAWETSKIPNVDINGNPRYNWAKQLNKVNLVWTFCNSAKQAMLDCGVTTPIEVIPHPIDPTTYHPSAKRRVVFDQSKLPVHDEWFKFLSIFQWIPRKDPKALILAYLSEFKPDENVVLMLKTYYMKTGDLAPIKQAITALKREFKLPYKAPRIMLVPGVLTDPQMADLMRSADCMVTTTKAEGFGLPQAEGMACGVPSVAPAGSAFLDYIDDTNGYPVQTHEEPVHGVSHSPWYFASQNWHRIDVMDLRRQMREAYEDRVGLKERSKAAVKHIALKFDPKTVGRLMKESLERLLANNLQHV